MTDHDDSDNRKDLTRIEDLSEFLHSDDADINSQFDFLNKTEDESVSLNSLDDASPDVSSENELEVINSQSELHDDLFSENEIPADDELPPDLPTETSSEITMEDSLFNIQTSPSEENFNNLASEDTSLLFSETPEENISEIETDQENLIEEIPVNDLDQIANETSYNSSPHSTVDFDEVKNFATNFTYGTVEGEGNPPYSLKLKNIKYLDDADNIQILLKEFEIINDKNKEDYELALKLGNVLIPQISEYTAIILAHKLRRFDLDIEIGLSDEIHPSKEQDKLNRGLLKKENLKQNITEKNKLNSLSSKKHEFLTAISNTVQGKKVSRYLGIITTSLFVNKEDIERLSFVQSELQNKQLEESTALDYQNFCTDFDEQHLNLVNVLKNKAIKNSANALLGIQFNLNLINSNHETLYQLTCSANQVILENE